MRLEPSLDPLIDAVSRDCTEPRKERAPRSCYSASEAVTARLTPSDCGAEGHLSRTSAARRLALILRRLPE